MNLAGVLDETPQRILEVLGRLSRESWDRIIPTIALPRHPVTVSAILSLSLKRSTPGWCFPKWLTIMMSVCMVVVMVCVRGSLCAVGEAYS